MHKILCFDTSSNSCSVSISSGQDILAFNQDMRPSMQAENLLPLIELSLKQVKMQYSDIDYLAVTTGPGSFTGIRIGLAAAQGILHASDIQGVGITNFEVAYYRLKQQVMKFDKAFVIINAYRGQQYVQEFGQRSSIKHSPKLVSNSDLVSLLKQQEGRIVCAGSGLGSIYEEIKGFSNLTLLPRFPVVKAYHTARLAHKIIKQGKVADIEPLYIRPPDAVVQKKNQ